MTRRIEMIFRKYLMLLALSLSFALPAYGGENAVVKGVYVKLPDFKFVFDGEKVEVLEFFSFYCGHCYEFEKAIPVIKGNFPKKIKWKNVPIYWGKGSSKPGEAYLLAEDAGKGEQMKKALFEAFFIDKKDIGNVDVLEEIGTKTGLGFEFSRKLRAGDKEKEANAALIMSKAYSIEETPTMVVAGNLKMSPSIVEHNMDFFRDNTITVIKDILQRK